MANLQANLQVPIRTAMLDTDGKVVLEWQNFFTALVQSVLGALESLQTQYLNYSHAGDVRGATVLNTANSVPLIGLPGVLAQGPLGEASVVITYVNTITGAGTADLTITSKTVTFTNGVETAHT